MTSAQYITPPPDFPSYVVKLYGSSVARKLIAWAKKEYDDAVVLFTNKGDWKTVDWLMKEFSAMRLLSGIPEFRRMVANISLKEYNKLTLRERVFLRRSYELFESLR